MLQHLLTDYEREKQQLLTTIDDIYDDEVNNKKIEPDLTGRKYLSAQSYRLVISTPDDDSVFTDWRFYKVPNGTNEYILIISGINKDSRKIINADAFNDINSLTERTSRECIFVANVLLAV